MSRPASRARTDSHFQSSAIKTDELVTWLFALCHAMSGKATVEACIRLRIHARVHWDVGQPSELGASHSARASSRVFCSAVACHCRLPMAGFPPDASFRAGLRNAVDVEVHTALSSLPVASHPARLAIQGAPEEAQRLWLLRGLYLSLAPLALVPPGSPVLLLRRYRIALT